MTGHATLLPVKLARNGFTLTQVQRERQFAIYRQEKQGQASQAWEVIRIKVKPTQTGIAGLPVQAAEVYPTSESWGLAGWTYNTLADAKTKLYSLLERASRNARANHNAPPYYANDHGTSRNSGGATK